MEQELHKIIQKAVRLRQGYGGQVGRTDARFSVEVPAQAEHGDYSTNVALVLAKQEEKNPREVAEQIRQAVLAQKNPLVKDVQVAGPGFINFFIADKVFFKQLRGVGKTYGTGSLLKGQKILVEHTQPNPFKAFHIGHLMNNAIGEAVSQVAAANGAKVKTASYHGDVGLHVAKAVWALKQGIPLDRAYATGHKAYEEGGQAQEEILAINKAIYENSNKEVSAIYMKGRQESLDAFNTIYKRLGSRFDFSFFESQTGPIGKKLVEKNLGKVFEQGENGAVIFRGENFEPKTHTRVFLNAEGLPTYEAKELGLAQQKKSAWGFTKGVTVTADEQDSFFKVTEVAVGQVFPDLRGKLHHLSHGMLKLPEGKMSSRTGNVITAEELIGKMKDLVKEKIAGRNLPESERGHIMETVAIGAIKYSILKQSIGSDIIYDYNKAVSFEGDSGPYLQYAYTRAQSVLEKAKQEGVRASFWKTPAEAGVLEKMIVRFPEVVARAGTTNEPHGITLYLTELASCFNAYYAKNKVVDTQDAFSPYKVALVEKFSSVMKNGLAMLGIGVLERM